MKLKFDSGLEYQLVAINSVIDLFGFIFAPKPT